MVVTLNNVVNPIITVFNPIFVVLLVLIAKLEHLQARKIIRIAGKVTRIAVFESKGFMLLEL